MKKNKIKKHHKINEEIVFFTVTIVGEGQPFECKREDALAMAKEKELDLVLINETNKICKFINYSKFLYELNKKPKSKSSELKEIKFSSMIGQSDIDYRVKHIREFLLEGHKVKLSLKFKGREIVVQKQIGQEVLLKVAVALEDIAIAESLPKLEGKVMFLILRKK